MTKRNLNRRVRVTFHTESMGMLGRPTPVATLQLLFDGNPGIWYEADGYREDGTATTTEATRRAVRGLTGQLANMVSGALPPAGWLS